MLLSALAFLLVATVAAALGFSGIAGTGLVKVLFLVFVALVIVSSLAHVLRDTSPRVG